MAARQIEYDQYKTLRALRKWIIRSGYQAHVCLKTGMFVMLGPTTVAHDGEGNFNFIPPTNLRTQTWGTPTETQVCPKYYEFRALVRSVIVHAPCEQEIVYQQFGRLQLEQTDQEFRRAGIPMKRVQKPETGTNSTFIPMNVDEEVGMTIWISIAPTEITMALMPVNLLHIQQSFEGRRNVLPIPYRSATEGEQSAQVVYLNVRVDLAIHRERTSWDETFTHPRYLNGAEGIFVGSNYPNQEAQVNAEQGQPPYPHDGENAEDGNNENQAMNNEEGLPDERTEGDGDQRPIDGQMPVDNQGQRMTEIRAHSKGWEVALKAIDHKQRALEKMMTLPNKYRRMSKIIRRAPNTVTNRLSEIEKATKEQETAVNELDGIRRDTATAASAAASDNSFTTATSGEGLKDVLSLSEIEALERDGVVIKTFEKDVEEPDEIPDLPGDKENARPQIRGQRKPADMLAININQSMMSERSLRASTPRSGSSGNINNNRANKTPIFSPNATTEPKTPRDAIATKWSNRVRGLLTTEALVDRYSVEELTAFVDGNPLSEIQRKIPKNTGDEMRAQRSPSEAADDDTKGQPNSLSQEIRDVPGEGTTIKGRVKTGNRTLSKRGRQFHQSKRQRKADENRME